MHPGVIGPGMGQSAVINNPALWNPRNVRREYDVGGYDDGVRAQVGNGGGITPMFPLAGSDPTT